jgi:Cu(I)/Ag(I) efflux system protein CusF
VYWKSPARSSTTVQKFFTINEKDDLMKRFSTFILTVALSATSLVFAENSGMKDMPMDSKSHSGMAGMTMGEKGKAAGQKGEVHTTTAVVKKVDQEKGKVTLAHEPIPSLNWPAMTMGFAVKEKKLLDQLGEGQKVQVELTKRGKDYVIVDVK